MQFGFLVLQLELVAQLLDLFDPRNLVTEPLRHNVRARQDPRSPVVPDV